MLFLAITGVMIATMLVGIGTSINIQRYRDSVSSLKALLQSQYSSIENVQNSRDNNWRCDSTARTSQIGTLQPVGQSDCILMGRYIELSGSNVTIATVNGFENPSVTPTGDDVNIIKTVYTLGLSTVIQDQKTLEWGTTIAWPVGGGTGTRSTGILILRSPETGSIYTFTTDSPVPIANVTAASLKAMIVPGVTASQNQKENIICVDSQGLVLTGNIAIVIHARAASESAIETRTNDLMASLGVATRC
jgi:hypothetical protein